MDPGTGMATGPRSPRNKAVTGNRRSGRQGRNE